MKPRNLIIGIAATIAMGIVVYFITKKRRVEKELVSVADAGYEIAHDVLYPLKSRKQKKR